MQLIVRALLGQLLADETVKSAIMAELKSEAAKTDTSIDDGAVTVFGEVWDVLGSILGK